MDEEEFQFANLSENRLHPEGSPGQMEPELRRWMGDREFERMKEINQRYTHASVDLTVAKSLLWKNLVTLSAAGVFCMVVLTATRAVKDLVEATRG